MKYYVKKNFEKNYDGKYHNFFIVLDGDAWIIYSQDYYDKYNSWDEYMFIPPVPLHFLKEIKEEETTLAKEDVEKLNLLRL